MRTYRIRILNVKGQTTKARYFICHSNSDALNLAQRILGTEGRAEVWLERALVGRIQAGETQVKARSSSPAEAVSQYPQL